MEQIKIQNSNQQENFKQQQTKIIQSLSDVDLIEFTHQSIKPQKKHVSQVVDFEECISFLNTKGKELFGQTFAVDSTDYEIIYKVLVYMIKDTHNAPRLKIDLNKGILLLGPVGCGKTTLMQLMNYINPRLDRYAIKSCREVSYDFISQGYEALHKYTYQSFRTREGIKIPKTWCFDDLGTENNLKYYGNECNVMAEILLSRYDLFVQRDMITHLTTNLNAQEIEDLYGNRVRSRMREMFNLISFSPNANDKRH